MCAPTVLKPFYSIIWLRYGTVIRADVNAVRIGSHTNVQDGCIIHVAKHNPKGFSADVSIGSRVTIGHGAVIHAATLEDECLVGRNRSTY